MKKQEVRNVIYEGLGEILIPAGFKGVKKEKLFRRKTPYGFQKVGNSLVDYSPTFSFACFVIIRFDAIEDILDVALSRPSDYWGVTGTVNLDLRFSLGQHLEFEVHSEVEIKEALHVIKEIFDSHVFATLDNCNSIDAVERLLNNDLDMKPLSRVQNNTHAGIVSAALVGRDDFLEIVSRYRHSRAAYQESFRADFEKFVEYVTKNVLHK
jgi:hypothetical protein